MNDKRKKMSKEHQEEIQKAKHDFDKELLKNSFKQMHLIKYNMEKHEDFKSCLKFVKQYEEMIVSPEEKQTEQANAIIENLYDKIVPEYLLEDHPPEIPETA